MKDYNANKNAHPTKRGPGRYHGERVPHGKPPSGARHGKHVPRIIGLRTDLTAKQLQPQRLDGETFPDYQARRSFVKRAQRGLAF